MKIAIALVAAALGAAAPAAAATGDDQDHVKLVYDAKRDRYCALMEVTGQRLPVRDCRTKEEWIKAGAKLSDAATPEQHKLAQK